MKQRSEQLTRRALAVLLSAALLLAIAGCGSAKGETVRYDGFTVRTEKPRALAETEAPERAVPEAETQTAEDYILNRSSFKFHYPWCSGAKDMKEKNRWDYHGTRESVLEMGYSPCKICNP